MPKSLHLLPSQNPKTPKVTSSKVAKGIALTMGVERTEMRSSAKAAKSKMDKGVAGRSMLAAGGTSAVHDARGSSSGAVHGEDAQRADERSAWCYRDMNSTSIECAGVVSPSSSRNRSIAAAPRRTNVINQSIPSFQRFHANEVQGRRQSDGRSRKERQASLSWNASKGCRCKGVRLGVVVAAQRLDERLLGVAVGGWRYESGRSTGAGN
jgi:hypothetical protein